MSIGADRQAIADALNTVDGVKAERWRPNVLSPGAGWPLLESLERDRDMQVVWRAVIILPPDERKASEWFDDRHEAVDDALGQVGYVERIQPGLVATDAGDLQAMIATLRKEA